MRELGRLMIRPRFIKLTRGSIDVSLRLIALLNQGLALAREFGRFLLDRGDARLAFAQPLRLRGGASVQLTARMGNEFATKRRHSESRFVFLAREGVVQFRENDDAAEQSPHKRFNRTGRDNFVDRPGQRTSWQTLADGFVRRSAEFWNEQSSLPKFLLGEPGDNIFGALCVLRDNRVQISAERGFDRRNKFWIDIDLSNERADDRSTIALGVVQTFEDSLRPLSESFAFGIQLAQNFQTRLLFRERPLRCGKLAFGNGEKVSALPQISFHCL